MRFFRKDQVSEFAEFVCMFLCIIFCPFISDQTGAKPAPKITKLTHSQTSSSTQFEADCTAQSDPTSDNPKKLVIDLGEIDRSNQTIAKQLSASTEDQQAHISFSVQSMIDNLQFEDDGDDYSIGKSEVILAM